MRFEAQFVAYQQSQEPSFVYLCYIHAIDFQVYDNYIVGFSN